MVISTSFFNNLTDYSGQSLNQRQAFLLKKLAIAYHKRPIGCWDNAHMEVIQQPLKKISHS